MRSLNGWVGAALLTAGVFGATAASAAVLVDQSPDAIGAPAPGFTATNQAQGQNFLVQFTLGSAAVLDGVDIYSDYGSLTSTSLIGQSVVIKIRNDVSGSPDVSNAFAYGSTITAEDSAGSTANPSIERLHSDFTSTALAAGTYWIGMSGDATEIGWNIQFATPSSSAWQLSQDTLQFSFDNDAAFAFRVDGASAVAGVPEPASWAMMIGGAGMVGGALRRRAKVRTTVRFA